MPSRRLVIVSQQFVLPLRELHVLRHFFSAFCFGRLQPRRISASRFRHQILQRPGIGAHSRQTQQHHLPLTCLPHQRRSQQRPSCQIEAPLSFVFIELFPLPLLFPQLHFLPSQCS